MLDADSALCLLLLAIVEIAVGAAAFIFLPEPFNFAGAALVVVGILQGLLAFAIIKIIIRLITQFNSDVEKAKRKNL